MIRLIEHIGNFVNRFLMFFVFAVAVAALLAPEVFLPATRLRLMGFPLINILLMVIMLGTGMSIDALEFFRMLRRPRMLLGGMAVKYFFMATGAWIAARLFSLNNELAFGMVLLGCMPTGTASMVLINIAEGNAALSVALLSLTTLLAPVLTPSLTYLLGGGWVEIDFLDMFKNIVIIVIVPVVIGMLIRRRAETLYTLIKPTIRLISLIAILIIVGVCVAPNKASIMALDSVKVIAALTVNFVIAAAGAILSTKFLRLDHREASALVIASLSLNTSLSAGIAATFHDVYPMAALPSLINVPLNILLTTATIKLFLRPGSER